MRSGPGSCRWCRRRRRSGFPAMVLEHRTKWMHMLRQIGPSLLGEFLLALGLALLNRGQHRFSQVAVPDIPIAVIGASLSILLGFRTASAYGRWWEARTLWGG